MPHHTYDKPHLSIFWFSKLPLSNNKKLKNSKSKTIGVVSAHNNRPIIGIFSNRQKVRTKNPKTSLGLLKFSPVLPSPHHSFSHLSIPIGLGMPFMFLFWFVYLFSILGNNPKIESLSFIMFHFYFFWVFGELKTLWW